MSLEDIIAFREKSLEKEKQMWIELLNDKYPIGKVVELDSEKLIVVGYCYPDSIPAVQFEKVATEKITKFIFNLPGLKESKGSKDIKKEIFHKIEFATPLFRFRKASEALRHFSSSCKSE